MPLEIIDPNIESLMAMGGQTLNYYQGRLCSCVNENNGQPILGHGCNQGMWYAAPVTTMALRQKVSTKFLSRPEGRIYDGGAQFTIPKFYEDIEQTAHKTIARGDILSVVGRNRRETDVLTRGSRDFLYAFDVSEVINISRGVRIYLPDVDYSIEGTTIIWLTGGEGPEVGQSYTVEYLCNQQYKVWDDGATDRGTDYDVLPRMVVCVLRHFTDPALSPLDDINTKEV